MRNSSKLKYDGYAVVFQEIPGEVSVAINITQCPYKCEGCHSPQLREDIGKVLDEQELDKIIGENFGTTCVLFMGGDLRPENIMQLADYVRSTYSHFKTAWYSGRDQFIKEACRHLDYYKVGSYKKDKGPLTSPTTNQILFKIQASDENDTYEVSPIIFSKIKKHDTSVVHFTKLEKPKEYGYYYCKPSVGAKLTYLEYSPGDNVWFEQGLTCDEPISWRYII